MTEQPVETEQEFLGNVPRKPCGGQLPAYVPGAHRMPRFNAIVHLDMAEAVAEELAAGARPLPGTPGADLMLTAEQHAHSAVMSLSCGELDEGIAWLQSALAFAQNHRHAEEFERSGQ